MYEIFRILDKNSLCEQIFKFILFFCSIYQNVSSQTSGVEEFNKLLVPYFKTNEPGGVVMVAKNGQIIYEKAFGMANMELDVPINDSTIFYIGSNTKQFTAVAILQLMEKGKIQLHDTLGRYISSCPYPVSSITIQQLLSHTSGLGDNNETEAYKLIDRKDVTPIELVNYFINLPMDFAPGSKWAYNNANFYILGYLIEKLTSKSYADYVTENIFSPAGMSDTYMGKELSIIKNRAPGYTNFRMGIQNTRITTIGALYSSGGIQSTTEDMLKWNRALKTGKLLKPKIVQLLYTPQILLNGKVTSYGMGFHLQELHGSPALRHGGLVEGFTSETLYLPQEDVYIVMLLNEETSKIPIVALVRIIAGLAINKPYSFDETPINKNELKRFSGLYENEMGELVNITEQNEHLIWQRPNGVVYTLHYAGNNEFFFDKDYLRTEFTSDGAGKIKSLKFSQVDIGLTEWFKTTKPLLKLSPERVADSLLKRYAGKYLLTNYDTITISRDGPVLFYQMNNKPKQILAAESNTSFFSLKSYDVRIEFINDAVSNGLALLFAKGNKSKKCLKL